MSERRFAALGSPIAHSRSPLLHSAAYGVLGLPWCYDAIEVTSGGLDSFVTGLGGEWGGLSLTMPLKREVLPLLDVADEMVELTGVANTLLLGERRRGFNTDIHGIAQSFREAGVAVTSNARILGGGATAASALVAIAQLGGARVALSLRDTSRAAHLVELGERMGLVVSIESLAAMDSGFPADIVISTLPSGAAAGLEFDSGLMGSAVLLDVAYDPWPSSLATRWSAGDGRVINGLEMLLHQALIQVRIFVAGDPDHELPEETGVIAAMRRSVGLPARG